MELLVRLKLRKEATWKLHAWRMRLRRVALLLRAGEGMICLHREPM